jgi:hypothetical protein
MAAQGMKDIKFINNLPFLPLEVSGGCSQLFRDQELRGGKHVELIPFRTRSENQEQEINIHGTIFKY